MTVCRERNDLPKGALGGMPVDPQGDENREPPPDSPRIPPWHATETAHQ